ncbi:hypothetical protein EYC80_000718 [Monilinia laxa]|uniref:Uncharacterized protein n=1 Tax=Monilinia laxa TaxID=61186 RepID=A0A5N6KBH5_MONLA|nr:hypothetical protein EYC80_000718 [Monilinia laxa]
MPSIISGLKNFKARRASAKELKSRENELKLIYQEMRAVDDKFNNASTHQSYQTEQHIYVDKTIDWGASEAYVVEFRRPSRCQQLCLYSFNIFECCPLVSGEYFPIPQAIGIASILPSKIRTPIMHFDRQGNNAIPYFQ